MTGAARGVPCHAVDVTRTVGEVLQDRANALTAIRLVLAAMVLVAHAASISGLADHPLVGGVGLGSWGVMGFFAISGYLVVQSRMRSGLGTFLVKQFLRLMPAFWMVNIVTAAVAAPFVAWWAGSSLDVGSAVRYPVENGLLVMRQWTIGGTLESAPYSSVWNGSLWTLAQEAGWYLVVAFGLLGSTVRRHRTAASVLLLMTLTALTAVGVSFAVLGSFFAAGMLLNSVRDRLPVSLPLVAAAGLLLVVAGLTERVTLVAPLPLAYVVLACSAVRLPSALLSRDLSYGVYLYAFPVSQVLAVVGVQRWGLSAFTVATAVLTVPLAWASWHWVEAPALRLAGRQRWPVAVTRDAHPPPVSRPEPASPPAG